MNREIKFRAYDFKQKKWLFGFELPNLGGFSLFGELMLMGEWAQTLNEYLFDRNGKKVDDLVVMQYTGLKDSKGVEIYEGDVVRHHQEEGGVFPPAPAKNCVIRFDENECGFSPYIIGNAHNSRVYMRSSLLTIIGNIYENPELLTK